MKALTSTVGVGRAKAVRLAMRTTLTEQITAALLAGFLLVGGVAACSDDPGEDRIGDGEINDEGD